MTADVEHLTPPADSVDPAGPTDLGGLVGEWVGTTRTWFTPGNLADESPVRARIRAVVPVEAGEGEHPGGGFVLYEYWGTMEGEPLEGVAIVGIDRASGQLVAAWVDSFHMGSDVMLSRGDTRPGGPLKVLGSYRDPSGGPDWGWRTEFSLSGPDRLTVTAYNILPDGLEAKAVEAEYTHR